MIVSMQQVMLPMAQRMFQVFFLVIVMQQLVPKQVREIMQLPRNLIIISKVSYLRVA